MDEKRLRVGCKISHTYLTTKNLNVIFPVQSLCKSLVMFLYFVVVLFSNSDLAIRQLLSTAIHWTKMYCCGLSKIKTHMHKHFWVVGVECCLNTLEMCVPVSSTELIVNFVQRRFKSSNSIIFCFYFLDLLFCIIRSYHIAHLNIRWGITLL